MKARVRLASAAQPNLIAVYTEWTDEPLGSLDDRADVEYRFDFDIRKGGWDFEMIATPRVRVEDCACITAHPDLLRPVLENHTHLANDPDSDAPVAEFAVTWPDGTVTNVRARLTSTHQANGRRWWFACPSCDRRCRCLYSPSLSTAFACRKCHALVYRSQYKPTPAHLFLRMWNFLEESKRLDKAYAAWEEDKKAREDMRAAWQDRVRVAD